MPLKGQQGEEHPAEGIADNAPDKKQRGSIFRALTATRDPRQHRPSVGGQRIKPAASQAPAAYGCVL